MERVTIFVRGQVQGVGFRWWTRARALELGLTGFARNMADGRVEICVQGSPQAIERLRTLVQEEPSTTRRPGLVQSCVIQKGDLKAGLSGFHEK
ncbi:MAG TPA: acylphosphatase [Actinobacteria bacterium]|jgi:acylphosphatase|nr:acylphosphatase [Actinomycetota bacterium]